MAAKCVNLILDTDIGPDCDDAGAITLLHVLSGGIVNINFLAMTNCTSNRFGTATIDAINLFHGRDDIPAGMYEKDGFLDDDEARKYTAFIAKNYPHRFGAGKKIPGARETIKNALGRCQDQSAVLCCTGPLNNAAGLLEDDETYRLVKNKIRLCVIMGTNIAGTYADWNIKMNIDAARLFFDKWPGPVVMCPYETGREIITGRDFGRLPQNHPVRAAYRIYNDRDEKAGRSSWDLCAAWYAVAGAEPFFELSGPYDVSISGEGYTVKKPAASGRFRFLLGKMPPDEIAAGIDAMWQGAGIRGGASRRKIVSPIV